MCHPVRHQRFERDLREREGFAPDLPAGDLRVGDADRERAAELLRVHAAAGRVTTDELEERLDRVYTARTGRELRRPLSDLPAERGAHAARAGRDLPVPPLMLAAAVLIAIALVTHAWGIMFLMWPLAMFLGHGGHRRRLSS